jgi:hypothetical protein
MHQEAADELVGIERHHPVSLPTFEAAILPFEGDAFVIERKPGGGWKWRRDGYSIRPCVPAAEGIGAYLSGLPRLDQGPQSRQHRAAAGADRELASGSARR